MAENRRLASNDQRPEPRRILYYVTDRTALLGDESARRQRLLEKIAEAARAGVDYIQLREKDLRARELEVLSREAVKVLDQLRTENLELRTALLINSRTDVALAVAADGVNLRSDDISPEVVRAIWRGGHGGTAALGCPAAQSAAAAGAPASENAPRSPLIGVSCHSPAEVSKAAADGASFALFSPVFEKKNAPVAQPPVGLSLLRDACRASIPVLALGGITLDNAQSCLGAGAAGIAGIRLFQENNIAEVVHRLRN
jgi:thiamine-phosphate pyrophosphorylase